MQSIAIIGASNRREKFSNKCVRLYKKLKWNVFPVNPNETIIEGIKCFPKIEDVPVKPDFVSIYLPAAVTLQIISGLKKKGITEVILNPGAESDELIAELKKNVIVPKMVCSIRMQGFDPEEI